MMSRLLVLVLVLALPTAAQAATLFSEDFESSVAVANANNTGAGNRGAAGHNCLRLGSTLNVLCHLVANGGSGSAWELDTKFTPFAQYLAGMNGTALDVMTVTDWAAALSSGRRPATARAPRTP